MNQQVSVSPNNGMRRALVGILFAAGYFVADVLRNALASMPLPLPSAPAEEAARYVASNRAALLAVGGVQLLSALALSIFAGCVYGVVRRAGGDGGPLPGLSRAGGMAAATLLAISALLSIAAIPVAAGGDLGLVGLLRTLNFRTGGTFHVAALGIFIGAASLVARREPRLLPRWICWLGIVVGVVALLSLASLLVYYANAFILLGRLLAFVWCIAAGIALALGKRQRRAQEEGAERHALA